MGHPKDRMWSGELLLSRAVFGFFIRHSWPEVLAKELALTALSPCPQAFCDDASGLKFNPVLYPKVR